MNLLVVYRHHEEHLLPPLLKILRKQGHTCKLIERMHLTKSLTKRRDLILSFGGDGTFLKTASFVEDITPVLGVDSAPGTREAFFERATLKNIAGKLAKPLKTVNLHRLEASINGKRLDRLTLNEFLITSEKPYHTALYKIDGEDQQSSGILVATAAGSTGWIRSAGGKVMPLRSKRFQFVVREPYQGKRYKPTKVKGILKPKERLRIVSCIEAGIIVADSNEIFRCRCGDVIEILLSSMPLQFVV